MPVHNNSMTVQIFCNLYYNDYKYSKLNYFFKCSKLSNDNYHGDDYYDNKDSSF